MHMKPSLVTRSHSIRWRMGGEWTLPPLLPPPDKGGRGPRRQRQPANTTFSPAAPHLHVRVRCHANTKQTAYHLCLHTHCCCVRPPRLGRPDGLLHSILPLLGSFRNLLAFAATCPSWRAVFSSYPSKYTLFPPLLIQPNIRVPAPHVLLR